MEAHRTTQGRPRWKMAAESLRSGRDAHRVHGIHAQGKALLQRVQRHASRTAMKRRLSTLFGTMAVMVLLSLAGIASPRAPEQVERPKIYSIAFARFKAVDVAKSRAFYSKILGLQEGFDSC